MIPKTIVDDYTATLPTPKNLNDPAFSGFGFLDVEKSSAVFLKQKVLGKNIEQTV